MNTACFTAEECYTQAVSMYDNLFPSNYSGWIFPYAGSTQNLSVSVQVFIFKLLALTNEKVLSAAVEIDLEWIDPNVNWLASENISSLTVNKSQLWTMNLYLMNPATSAVSLRPDNLVQLSAAGNTHGANVATTIITSIDAICDSMTLVAFPFDRQQCTIHVAYSDGSHSSVNFANATTSLAASASNDEWTILNVSVITETLAQGDAAYPGFAIRFSVQRQSYFYLFNLIIPTVILYVLVALVFLLPTEQGGKIKLSSTLVLSVYVLQNSVGQLIPNFRPGETPHFVVAQQVGFILAAVSLVESVLVQTLRIWSPHFPMSVNQSVDRVLCACWRRRKKQLEQDNASDKRDAYDSLTLDSFAFEQTTSNSDSLSEMFRQFVDTEKQRLEIEKRKMFEQQKRMKQLEVANRAWRKFEYILNAVALVVYIACLSYYFGYYIYKHD